VPYRKAGIRNWVVLVTVAAMFAVGTFAVAQQEGSSEPASETETADDDLGPRWQRPDAEGWTPGTPGPPPWAGQDDEGGDGADD
jgi:hypothetical protein